jgi:hypothetical protein
MSYSIDDTQPRSPFEGDPINLQPTIRPDDEGGRSGSCLLNVVIGGMVLLVAVAIVALSAAAGWTYGQREANTHSIATQNAAVGDQVQRIQSDVDSGNTVVLKARIDWLATQTPGVPGIENYVMTATALYLNLLPTATLAPTAMPAATTEAAATEDVALTQEASGGYDLTSILSQAESAVASSQWQNAIDLLDVILGADPTFDSAHVNQLMSQALNSYALQLYNANQPAQANLIVTRARQFGSLADGLDYENMAADLYLTAQSAVGTGSPLAISDLQKVLNLGPGRYYQEAQKLLYNMYIAQGDAYVVQGNNCSAAGSYQQAMNVFGSGAANGKYAAAQNACVNAPPTTDPNLVIPSDGSVAPVGVVATPG